MKSFQFFVSLSFLFISFDTFSQTTNDNVIYLDSLSYISNKENCKFYLVIKDVNIDKTEYLFEKYYASGKIHSKGSTTNKEELYENGEIVSFYENGNQKSVLFYEKNCLVGKCTYFYENGKKELEGEYVLETKDGESFSSLKIINSFDKNNLQTVINGNGIHEDNGKLDNLDDNYISKGTIKNGLRDGNWSGYNKKLKMTFNESFYNGKFITGTSIDSLNISRTYNKINVKPEFAGGVKEFCRFVAKNYVYPELELPKGISGRIVVKFSIDSYGKVGDVKVLKHIGYGSDVEAIKMMNKSKNWIPAYVRGIAIKAFFILPIVLQQA
jgi:antitoxin component YwqK of YwqJK toxin-antitoxin module